MIEVAAAAGMRTTELGKWCRGERLDRPGERVCTACGWLHSGNSGCTSEGMNSQASPRGSRTELAAGVVVSGAKGMALRAGAHNHPGSGALLSPGRTRRRANSNQGSRSGSPLTVNEGGVPLPDSHAHGTHVHGHGHSVLSPSPSPGRSPYQSPAHSRSSSMTSVKSLLRDRSVERAERETFGERHGPLVRDRSLDRQLDRHQRELDRPLSHRERSIDRDQYVPHMGARSLDRETLRSNLVRSRSIDQEYLANQAMFLPPPSDLRHARDTLLLDLQAQMAALNKECMILQQELDLTRDKLSSSMNSIKTFWSPELKKERVLRKEESARLMALSEQLRITQAENKVRYIHFFLNQILLNFKLQGLQICWKISQCCGRWCPSSLHH